MNESLKKDDGKDDGEAELHLIGHKIDSAPSSRSCLFQSLWEASVGPHVFSS